MFVYIVPNGELRGGAWVVLDPSINPAQMEMYADRESRAGVLEPEGVIEIRSGYSILTFPKRADITPSVRRDRILTLMERLDSVYAGHKKATKDATLSEQAKAKAAEDLEEREKLLMPTYTQMALLYADLHE